MSVVLKVKNLKKFYGKFAAVDNIDFEVKEGEIFGLLGPNGAGKTTTLECIEGIKSYDSGIIEIFGKDEKENMEINKLIGVQLQSSSLQGNITALEAMTLFCKWKKVPVRKDLLDTFGLGENYRKQYENMSTGQKRRLHLALAIAHEPKLLILDEPTAGLDVEGRVSLHKEIRRLKQGGVTIILTSHDMAEVETLCDRIAIIISGKITTIGTPSEIKATNSDMKISVKTLNNSLLNKISIKHNSETQLLEDYITFLTSDIEETLSEILSIVKENEDKIVDLKVERSSLEERFMEIINGEREEE